MATKTKGSTRRIDWMMHGQTGEIDSPHLLGHTASGKAIYLRYEGWHPVAEMADGTYADSTGYRLNADGHYVI